MNDINTSMVNDNIVDPNYATLINSEGAIVESKDVDSLSSGTATIYDDSINTPIKDVAQTVLRARTGLPTSEKAATRFTFYSKIPLTNWTLCIA